MAEIVTLVTHKRAGRGSRAARKLRAKGQVPAVLYGHKEECLSLTLTGDDLHDAVRHKARVVDLQTDSAPIQKALIREIQWDHLGKEILHVDFERVSADERIRVPIPIELKGTAPGVVGGGVLDQPLHSLMVECPAISVPDSIRVSIAELQIGAFIYVRDLHLPEGVTTDADPDAVVVHVATPQVEPEPGAAPATGGVEPEVIGRKAAEEEEEKE